MRRSFIGLFFYKSLRITTLLDGFSIFPNGSIFLTICTVVLGFFAIRGLMDFDFIWNYLSSSIIILCVQ